MKDRQLDSEREREGESKRGGREEGRPELIKKTKTEQLTIAN